MTYNSPIEEQFKFCSEPVCVCVYWCSQYMKTTKPKPIVPDCVCAFVPLENIIARGLSVLLSSGCFISETSLISYSLTLLVCVLYSFLIIVKKTSLSSSSSLHLLVSARQCHTHNPLFSVRLPSCIMSSAWDGTFCNLAFNSGPRGSEKREWDDDEKTSWIDGTSLSLWQQDVFF